MEFEEDEFGNLIPLITPELDKLASQHGSPQLRKLKEINDYLATAEEAPRQATDRIGELLESGANEASQATSVMGGGVYEILSDHQVFPLLEYTETLTHQYYSEKICHIIFGHESASRLRNRQYSYEQKRRQVQVINAMLREKDLAFAHPETGEACLLVAVTSYDEQGRYTLQNRVTKKRSGSYKWLFELFPFKLVPDVPRREGVIERRKKKRR